MSLPNLFRHAFRSEIARESVALHDCRGYLGRQRAFLPYRRYLNATPFSTISKHYTPSIETESSSQSVANPATVQPSPSPRQKKTRDQTDATLKPKRKANAAKSSASPGSKTAPKPLSGSLRKKTHSATDRAPMHAKPKKKKREGWQIQKDALKDKFQDGWNPPKKLSPDALEGIRHLHSVAPDKFTTPVLAEQFEVSPEAIRRILKSKWRASEADLEDRRVRWERRHDRIWSHLTQLGLRPKTKRTESYDDAGILYENHSGPKRR